MNQDKINEQLISAIEQLSLEITQVQDALSSQTASLSELEQQQGSSLENLYKEPNVRSNNDLGVIEVLTSQITSPCMSCENAKLTVEIDDPTNLIFECLASVTTKKPVLACNKYAPALERENEQ